MNKQQGFSTLLGITLTVVILGAGAYWYIESTNNNFEIEDQNISESDGVMEEEALENNGEIIEENSVSLIKKEDAYFLSIYDEAQTDKGPSNQDLKSLKLVTKGDINSDGLEDAVVFVSYCGASCAFHYDFLLQNINAGPSVLEKGERYNSLVFGSSAVKTSVKEIKIIDGKVIFTGYAFGEDRWDILEESEPYKTEDLETYEFSIINGVLN